jgi:chromatin remodeling complex protein RSC6
MPKGKKTETTMTATAPEVPVEVLTEKSTTSKKTSKTEKTTTPKSAKNVSETDVVLTKTETTTATVETSEISTMSDAFTEFLSKLQSLTTQIASLKTEFRFLEKRSIRELKAAQKTNAKRKRKSSNRAPSGFVKPTLISNELAGFLNKPEGTEMARTEVTREINGYIREHSLQDKENGRKINPDKKLATLLKIKSGEELTYFNLQRYMSPHFAKSQKAETATVTAS